MDQQPELLQKLSEGNFTLRIMYEQFQNILNMGPLGQVIVYLRLYLASVVESCSSIRGTIIFKLLFRFCMNVMLVIMLVFPFTEFESGLSDCYEIWQVMSMIPGFSQEFMPKGREKESQAKIKKFMTMMDSMTDEGFLSFLPLPSWLRVITLFSFVVDLFASSFCIN